MIWYNGWLFNLWADPNAIKCRLSGIPLAGYVAPRCTRSPSTRGCPAVARQDRQVPSANIRKQEKTQGFTPINLHKLVKFTLEQVNIIRINQVNHLYIVFMVSIHGPCCIVVWVYWKVNNLATLAVNQCPREIFPSLAQRSAASPHGMTYNASDSSSPQDMQK